MALTVWLDRENWAQVLRSSRLISWAEQAPTFQATRLDYPSVKKTKLYIPLTPSFTWISEIFYFQIVKTNLFLNAGRVPELRRALPLIGAVPVHQEGSGEHGGRALEHKILGFWQTISWDVHHFHHRKIKLGCLLLISTYISLPMVSSPLLSLENTSFLDLWCFTTVLTLVVFLYIASDCEIKAAQCVSCMDGLLWGLYIYIYIYAVRELHWRMASDAHAELNWAALMCLVIDLLQQKKMVLAAGQESANSKKDVCKCSRATTVLEALESVGSARTGYRHQCCQPCSCSHRNLTKDRRITPSMPWS